jgi:glycosyltransferase involved in cell wall biosynthesis
MPTLTVLICTHNRARLLERTLASLNAARRPAGWRVDILVAANACNDDTAARLDRTLQDQAGQDRLPLAWFAEPTPGKSHALNAALPRVSGDLVAFVDDDHRVDAGYLEAVCRAADSYPEADLFCGRILPDWDGSEPAWVHHDGRYRIYPLPVPRFDLGAAPRTLTAEVAIPGGGNLFLRTGWLARVGAFSTELGPTGHDLGGSEDTDWVLRALQLGARMQYAPDVVQHHYVDTARLTLPYIMKKAYKRTATTVRLDPRLSGSRVPKFVYRKLAGYVLAALTAAGQDRRRFFLVRTAAALGEIAGYRQRHHPHAALAQPRRHA